MTQLSEQARTRALERFQLLRLHLEDGVPLARVARERGIALRTTERWLRQYRQDGLLGLARKVHANRGQRRLSWQRLGLLLEPDNASDAEAMATVMRITGGNFRLIERLFSQIDRVLKINSLQAVTREAVETARESLVIGPP